jgi:catechol 2,3-dioxygenase-like lactoylglutathione lyase family enzyme
MAPQRNVAVVSVAQTPHRRAASGLSETEMIEPAIRQALDQVGATIDDIGFVCSGSSDYLAGQAFSFVMTLDAVGAWPPISESHVEMDGAWALYEAWLRLQHGDVDVAVVYAYGRSSYGPVDDTLTLQLDPYTTKPLEPDPLSLAALQARLEAAGMICDGPIAGASPFAISSLFFCDPSGNNLAVYVPVKPNATAAHPRAPNDQLTAIGYLQLEAPDLEASVRFYCDTFSLPTPKYGVDPQSGATEARILMPSGQALVLTEIPFGPKGMKLSRFEAGPHLAFFLPATRWDAMMVQLEKCGIQHGDRAAIAKGRTSVELDTYFEDPAGYVIQLISALET